MRLFAARFLAPQEPADASQGTGELVVPPDLPHLALAARLHGVEATSCQAERKFSSLPSVLIGTLRASMMVFLKLNQRCLPEVQKYNAVIAAQQERRGQCLQDVQSTQEAAAGETMDVEI